MLTKPTVEQIVVPASVGNPATTLDVALQQLNLTDASGASRVGYRAFGTLPVDRTVQDKLRESVTFQDFGAHSIEEAGFEDFDSTEAIKNTFAYAFANNKAIHVIGVFKISGPIVRSGTHPISLIGNGPSHSRIIYANSTATIQLESTNANVGNSWVIDGISFICTGPDTETALKLSSVKPNKPANGSSITRCWFGYDVYYKTSDLNFNNNKFFKRALHLHNLGKSFIDSINMFGHAVVGSGTRRAYGIYLTGDFTPGPMISRVHMAQMERGISKDNAVISGEQLNVSNCNFVVCNVGIYLDSTLKNGDPGLFVSECHFACYREAMYTKNFNQMTITGNLIYGGNVNDIPDINVVESTCVNIHNNIFAPDTVATGRGCVKLDDVNFYNVHANMSQGVSNNYGLHVTSTCRNGRWANNNWDQITGEYVINDVTNIKEYNGISCHAPGYVSVNATTAVIPIDNDTTNPVILDWSAARVVSTAPGTFTGTYPSRLVVPKGITRIRLDASVTFAANTVGRRMISIIKNRGLSDEVIVTSCSAAPAPLGVTTINISSGILGAVFENAPDNLTPVRAGDYFEVGCTQTSGNDLDVVSGTSTSFCMEFIA